MKKNGKLINLGLTVLFFAFLLINCLPGNAAASAIRGSMFDANTLAANDDGSTGLVGIGFDIDFFGVTTNQLFVNNNGNVTLDSSLGTFTPFDLTSTGRQIIAPFFADVDTRDLSPVTYGTGTVDGRDAFGVNWVNVGHFVFTEDNLANSFQLVLIDRSDTGTGNFDIEFNYDQILWETGGASGGSGGLGGSSARVGWSNGTGDAGTFFELSGSAVNGAFLDSNLTDGLIHNSLNSSVDGRYIFSARSGIIDPRGNSAVPEPSTLLLLGCGLLGMAGINRKK
jgi:hypothetical protein